MSTDSSPIRILVVDDHQLIRVGIAPLLQEFPVYFRRVPAGIFRGHSPDQASGFQCDCGSPATRPDTPADVQRRAVPPDHRYHDDHSVRSSWPNQPQKDPERPPWMPWNLAVL